MIKRSRIVLAGILVAVVMIMGGCGGDGAAVKDGDLVSVHYTGRLDGGEVLIVLLAANPCSLLWVTAS